MTLLLVENDVDVWHVKIELDMTWIACIKRLEVSGMTWLLVEHDVDVLHVEIELEMTWIEIESQWLDKESQLDN
jgi:hypothetical protein